MRHLDTSSSSAYSCSQNTCNILLPDVLQIEVVHTVCESGLHLVPSNQGPPLLFLGKGIEIFSKTLSFEARLINF